MVDRCQGFDPGSVGGLIDGVDDYLVCRLLSDLSYSPAGSEAAHRQWCLLG